MDNASDLVSAGVLKAPASMPAVMAAVVLDISPLRVTVRAIDGGARALLAFGTFPDAVPGDEMRVQYDEYGGLVAVAWEAS